MTTNLEDKEFKREVKEEYTALRKILGEMLLEHSFGSEANEDIAYYTRKFNEARERLRR
jgi:hypothetical protein